MVNSKKKMNKSTVAIVVLALLLIVSLVLTATGAWFTDHKDGTSTTTANFGKIQLDTATLTATATDIKGSDLDLSNTNVMPGDIITLTGTVKLATGSEKAYVFVAMPADTGSYTLTSTGWTSLTNHDGVYYAEFNAEDAKTLTLKYDTKDVTEDYSTATADSKELQYMTKSVLESIAFKVAAVQFRNVDDAAAAYEIVKANLNIGA